MQGECKYGWAMTLWIVVQFCFLFREFILQTHIKRKIYQKEIWVKKESNTEENSVKKIIPWCKYSQKIYKKKKLQVYYK